jgi:hypothetical protein
LGTAKRNNRVLICEPKSTQQQKGELSMFTFELIRTFTFPHS